ncbi:MAG TPA: hypothetical protein VN372_12660 [Methanospirillum sp.]|nr:hypothetical protein [Methanospirillum sp.]
MDRRSILAGILLISSGFGGSALLSMSIQLSPTGFAGLLLITLPPLFLLWYLLFSLRRLEEKGMVHVRQLHRDIGDHASMLARRYDETSEQMAEINGELIRRVYR